MANSVVIVGQPLINIFGLFAIPYTFRSVVRELGRCRAVKLKLVLVRKGLALMQ
jgi:hypothetical protein